MGRREALGGASKTVAIKLLAAHLAEKPTYRRMFVDEARLTMMLGHSNVVQVFDVGEHGGRSYLVMEWVDGLDLAQLGNALREAGEPVPLVVAAHVVGEVLRGLGYAHELRDGEASRTIVHRDVSPHNVLISVSGEVKISDFGVARLASEETSGVHVRGKLRYMPPEQLRGESKHATVDLFAVGAVFQELLDGVRFRGGLQRETLFAKVIQGEVPPLRREDVPAELVAVRDGLLAADPAERIQSAAEALALLRQWPGYRNATDELAALVRDHAGLVGPRSGLTVVSSNESLELSEREPTRREAGAAAGEANGSELLTRAFASETVQPSHTTPAVREGDSHARPRRGGPSRRVPVSLGLSVAAIGVLIGLGVAVLGADEGVAVATVQADAIVVGAAVAPAPAPSPTPAAVIDAPSTVPADEPPTPVAEPEPEAESKPAPRPSKAKPSKAKVEIAASEFFFVWVKIGGREVAPEPIAKLSLSPGTHDVYLREAADKPWRKAGRIQVDAGRRYRVALRKPASLELERLD